MPSWVGELYIALSTALTDFPIASESDSRFDVLGRSKVRPIPK
jgi:hypothetical protein